MAKKKINQNTNPGSTPAKSPVHQQRPQPTRSKVAPAVAGEKSFLSKYAIILIPAAIGILTYICLKACTVNELTNWDDLGYIKNCPLIKDMSDDWLKNIFALKLHPLSAVNPVMGNYHPITMMLYALEYHKYGLEPWIYHFDSVIAHVVCTIAVFFFVNVFTRRIIAATIVALLFGLHPMHVESVAWAAGRKDILYGLFYVLAMTCYVFYLRAAGNKKITWYIALTILFLLSLLSKAVAVTLPLALFLIDYFEGRQLLIPNAPGDDKGNIPERFKKSKINYWLVLDKIPLLALAYGFGRLATNAQIEIGAYASLDASFTNLERFALGCYAFCTYLWKAIIPTGLCNFYPYPLKVGNPLSLPGIYYIYPVIALGLIASILVFARKNKIIMFGFGFFILNIILLLQFIPVGGAILSDRYGYIPYLGLFLIIGWYVSNYFEVKEKIPTGKILLGIMIGYCLVLGYMSNERCKDWYDSVTLWQDDIDKHPEAPVGYFYLGQEYFTRYELAVDPKKKKIYADSALAMFNASIQRKPDYINPIICVAELQRSSGLIDAARTTYYRALSINSKSESAYLGLGVVLSIKQQFDSAGYYFRTALSIKPFSPEGHSNFANYLDIVGKLDSSLLEYAESIRENRDVYIPYMNRARIYLRQEKPDEAMKDIALGLQNNPNAGDLYYLRARCYGKKGNKAAAIEDVKKARSLGSTLSDPVLESQLKP